ncbi:MAG: 50S ribosomal protein L9 [Hydrogenothermaceae bacterium]|nr:50S ribosomal protein L9 [Hydrogenothermaceae bacterium]
MKVILVKDVEGWGSFGDTVEVKRGFARNYLLPKGLAVEATQENIRHIQNLLTQKARKLEKEKERAVELAKKIDGTQIEISRPVGVTGKMYGSVTTADIVEKLKEKGFDIDRKKVMLRNPIRNLGGYTIQLRLHPEVSASIKVDVVPQE